MGPPDVIPYVSNREVDWVVFMLAGCDRSCRFVSPKDDWDKGCPVRVRVVRDEVLFVTGSVVGKVVSLAECTYTLLPSPVPSHEITVSTLVTIKLSIGDIVDAVD